jgi:hypothetical protein
LHTVKGVKAVRILRDADGYRLRILIEQLRKPQQARFPFEPIRFSRAFRWILDPQQCLPSESRHCAKKKSLLAFLVGAAIFPLSTKLDCAVSFGGVRVNKKQLRK